MFNKSLTPAHGSITARRIVSSVTLTLVASRKINAL